MKRLVTILAVMATAAVLVGGCFSPPKPATGLITKVERTTVTVRDPDGKVIRIEEKETVLQDYVAREPVRLKTVAPPAPKRVSEGD